MAPQFRSCGCNGLSEKNKERIKERYPHLTSTKTGCVNEVVAQPPHATDRSAQRWGGVPRQLRRLLNLAGKATDAHAG